MSAFDKIFKTCAKWCVKHSVEIAMTGAIVGVGLTVFTTSRATLAIDSIVKEEDLSKKEKVKLSIKPALPAAASVIFATASIAAMYHFGKKKQAALLGLLISTQQVFNKYRQNEQKRIGKDKESEEFAEAVAEAKNLDNDIPELKKLENEYIFCESITGQFFTGTKSNFWASAYAINGAFHEYGMAGFNQWLQYLGCDEDDSIDDCGWCYEGSQYYNYNNIEISLVKRVTETGKEYYLITYTTLPHSMFLYPYDKGCSDDNLVLLPFYNTEMWKNLNHEEMEGFIEHDMERLSPRK